MFHLLGIDPNGFFPDNLNRPHPITKGEPIAAMLASSPAKIELCKSEGDLALVPPFDARLLLDTDFKADLPLVAPAPPSREKGWRAFPIWTKETSAGFGVWKEAGAVAIGYGLEDNATASVIEQGSQALLAQEIRNARGGHYALTIKASGVGSSADEFDKAFLANMTCRLVLFRFQNINKDPRAVGELASTEFRPSFGKVESFKLDRFLGSTTPGANFSIGNGLGIAIVVEKKTPGQLTLPKDESHRASLRIESVTLELNPRKRDESVTV
jgi:hypothetical protein